MISRTRKSSAGIRREDVNLSDSEILSIYLGIHSIPCVISSPLRDDDDTPSFSFYDKGGVIIWKDFGTGQAGDVIKLLSLLWNVKYTDVLMKLKLDMGQHMPSMKLLRIYRGKIHLTSNSDIKVKVREWMDWDREYWNSYGISEQMCNWCNVHPISQAFFTRIDQETKRKQTVCVPMDKYAYAYFEWKDGVQSIKLYQPFSAKMKWLSKHDSSVWDLWKQAFNYADTVNNNAVVITSSRKDAMCIWENLHVPAMSLQGEGYVPKPQVMKQVLGKFKSVYIWYDNDFKHKEDNPGQDNARKIRELYPSIKNICIPSELECKDPSDLVKKLGVKTLKLVWNKQK